MHQLQPPHVPDFRGDVLVIKHVKRSLTTVVDVEEQDIGLINLLVTWYEHSKMIIVQHFMLIT